MSLLYTKLVSGSNTKFQSGYQWWVYARKLVVLTERTVIFENLMIVQDSMHVQQTAPRYLCMIQSLGNVSTYKCFY